MDKKVFEVIGFGALNVDQLYLVDKIASKDEESFIKNNQSACGGSAANTIIGLSKLGIKTSYIGKIANDKEGLMLLRNLQKEDVDTSNIIKVKDGSSGVLMGFVDVEGERALYVNPGVNDDIKFADLDLSSINSSKMIHLSSFVGDSFIAQNDLIDHLDDSVILSFDPGAIYVDKGFKSLEKILKRTNIYLTNEIELKTLFKSLDDFNVNKRNFYEDAANYLIDFGIETVVVKRGSKGVFAADEIGSIREDCFKVNCVDSTGAGDSFNSGFLYSKLKGYSLKKSCIVANWIASKSIQKVGAANFNISIEELDRIIDNIDLLI